METTTKNKAHAQNGIAKTINKVSQNGEANKQPLTESANGTQEPEKQIPVHKLPEPPKSDEIKVEASPAAEAKPVLNLEAKLKVVEDLHRRSVQRLT